MAESQFFGALGGTIHRHNTIVSFATFRHCAPLPATRLLHAATARYNHGMYYVYELIRNTQVVYVGCSPHPGRCFDQHTARNREFDHLRVISSHEKRWEAVMRAQTLLEACPLYPAYQPPRRPFSAT